MEGSSRRSGRETQYLNVLVCCIARIGGGEAHALAFHLLDLTLRRAYRRACAYWKA